MPVSRALVILGCVLAAIGLLLLTPLADFLPVDFSAVAAGDRPPYMKVVPSSSSPFGWAASLFIVGLSLVLLGRFVGSRNQ